MPDIKVYIRKQNIEKWNAIEEKSEWINTLLDEIPVTSPVYSKDKFDYGGLDLNNYCYRLSNNTVYEVGDEMTPYDGADEGMVLRLKQLGKLWKY
jgi:hypothetical protein